MSKTKIQVNKKTGIFKIDGDGNNTKVVTRKMSFKIGEIKPENFYMNARLTKSRKGKLYGELLYLHEGKWVRPIITLPQMNGCRFYRKIFNDYLIGNLSPENSIQRKTAERIVMIHKRIETIIKNHPTLKSIKGGFPITRLLRRREDKLTGKKIYTIIAEVEEERVYGSYIVEGTVFLDKDGKLMESSLSDLEHKEVDVRMAIDISFISLSNNKDAIRNKIKIVAIKIKEEREIVRNDDSDEDSDDDSDDEIMQMMAQMLI